MIGHHRIVAAGVFTSLTAAAICAAGILVPVRIALGRGFPQIDKLTASDGALNDFFGTSVSISGDTAVVGALADDDAGSNSGSAYVFVRSGGAWAQQQELTASDATPSAQFGFSVSIDGDTAVVGAPFDAAGAASGSTYVFVRSGGVWTQQQKLIPSDAAQFDLFGTSVWINGDTLVVGARGDDDAGSGSGSAYVFVRSGSVWTQQQKLTASDAAQSDGFGRSVSIGGDTALIGSPNDDDAASDSGSAYVFVRSRSVWTQQQKLTPSDSDGTIGVNFGWSVAIGGDTVLIGSPHGGDGDTLPGSTYAFVRSGSVWTQQQKLTASDGAIGDALGRSVSIGPDTALIGAPFDDDAGGFSGSAYIFARSGGVWTQQHKLTAADAARSDEFGYSVSISGGTAVVGAQFGDGPAVDSGSAYVFGSDDADSDGDGLLDDWEDNGIPYTDVNGTLQHYTLPGANKNHKDLYVEVDAMTFMGLSFSTTPAGLVEQAFANAPVANPNGSPGISLHIQLDETNLTHVAVWPTNGCWPNDFDTYRNTYFGTFNERNNDDPATIAARLGAKKKAYRYCIVADEASGGAAGCGERPGENSVIFLGGAFLADGDHDDEDAAAVFMHELGHNLGLGHGGADGVNGKPNYISIMNYVNTYRTGWNEEFWTLDYSRDDLEPLVENALDETQGVGYSPSPFDHWWMPFCVNFDNGTSIERQMRTVHTTGQPRDFGDPQGTGELDGEIDPLVTQDLNYWGPDAPFGDLSNPSPGEVLFGHNDWANLQLPLPGVSSVAGGKPPTYPTDELTSAQIQWINDNVPAPCFADIAPENLGDGAVDIDDLLMVINHWGECAIKGPCQADIAPLATGDRTVNVDDLLAVINAWGQCP